MAATPGSPGKTDSEAEPFSPSVFLDLPPTPRPVGDGAASSDDLVLPFISRMLMEEDMDDKFFYHYPDHPALLQAQQPYAQILSAAAAAAPGSFTANNGGGGPCTLSASSDDAPSFVGVDEFTAHEANQLFLPQQDTARSSFPNGGGGGGGADIESSGLLYGAEEATTATTSPPTGDGEHGAPLASTFFSGQNRVSMDMLNEAFLRGREEAKKFLPTDNILLVEAGGSKLSQGIAAGEVRNANEDKVDRIGGNGGRGCKNRCNWQYLETETTARSTKLMVPEPEETGEVIDEIIVNEYRLCLSGMLDLRIPMDGSKDGKKIRKGKRNSALGGQSSNEVVDLHTLLIHCAQAVSMDDRQSATVLLRRIRQHSSPIGDANQRLAHCFAEGLEARMAGMGSQVYKSLKAKRTSLVEFLKAYQLYLTVCCFKMMAYRFSNMSIANVVAGRKKLHIVDYGVRYGIQWPSLLGWLATREGGPPEVRITGIDLPQPGFRPAAQIEETGRRLSKCAHQFSIPFRFQSIAAKWETVCVDDLNIDPEEVLIVNGLFDFGNLMDEGVDIHSPSPRDGVLGNIRKMRPDVFILCNVNGSHGAPFFVARFREVLFFFSALFDMLDATVPRDNDQRLLVERDLFGRFALNVIACEGSDRVERHETYKQWQVRNHRAGLRQLPLDLDIVKVVRKKAKDSYHKDFVIDVDHQWLLQGWKGRIICALSTWVAANAFSKH
ncbi:hypothetical protein HU200_034301 [Digitaria exilis]|uniref:GRAS family transcription factor n=1 Tax=Digitaria exilis TaxID=1010633 RepID=A0A835BTY4_9POAL|nr:hypothetical protein HU200_034301 [Digitaria exilis]